MLDAWMWERGAARCVARGGFRSSWIEIWLSVQTALATRERAPELESSVVSILTF